MSLLILDRPGLEIRTEDDALVLFEAGEHRCSVPIKQIERCVIHGSKTVIEVGVLMKLAEAGITTVLMGQRHTRRVAIVLGSQHNDPAVRLAQAQRVMDDAACRAWALALVRAKLARQAKLLRHWQAHRVDGHAHHVLRGALHTLGSIQSSLLTNEPLPLETLRGQEGAAAHAYFIGLAAVMPPALHFTGRKRRPPPDPVNVCLSLGYTMLNTLAVQACTRAGLDPLLGFYHRPVFGRESLASDLIEPLRAAVDEWVWELLRSRTLREDHFSTSTSGCLLGPAGRKIFYRQWHTALTPWDRWLRAQAQMLARDLRKTGAQWMEVDAAGITPYPPKDCTPRWPGESAK